MNSTEYYAKNPDAAARKVAYQKKVNARPQEKRRRAELNKERRRRPASYVASAIAVDSNCGEAGETALTTYNNVNTKFSPKVKAQ